MAVRGLESANVDGRELVTVDLGNSSCKARAWVRADAMHFAPTSAFESPTASGVGAKLARWLADVSPNARAALSSVASRELETEVSRALLERFGVRFAADLASGLSIDYRTPETLGRDRVFAARGALDRLARSCLVVDAGTALTVDAVVLEPSGRGRFLGGAIAPGPRLLARALGDGAARLFTVEPRAGVRALGRDTREALEAGVSIGFRGAARELVLAVSREADLERAPIAIGGGARRLLLEPAFVDGRELVELDDLVQLGLCAALCDPRA